MSRQALAEASGLKYDIVIAIGLDRRTADPAAVAAICRALPREEAAACLVARLRDELPEEHAGLVVIEPRAAGEAQEPPADYGRADLPADLRDAITKLTRAATLHRDWRDLLLDLAKICDP